MTTIPRHQPARFIETDQRILLRRGPVTLPAWRCALCNRPAYFSPATARWRHGPDPDHIAIPRCYVSVGRRPCPNAATDGRHLCPEHERMAPELEPRPWLPEDDGFTPEDIKGRCHGLLLVR